MQACGGGGSSQSVNTISVLGVDGEMAGADVAVFHLQDYLDDQQSAENLLLNSVTTDINTGLADNLELIADAGLGPFMVVISANQSTLDLSTGLQPVIGEVKTIIQTISRKRVYATPLTTAAVTMATHGESVADDVFRNLPTSQKRVKAIFGFGMGDEIDIFKVAPVLDEDTLSEDKQREVAQYRSAIEALAAIVDEGDFDFQSLVSDVVEDGVLEDTNFVDAVESISISKITDRLNREGITSIAELLNANLMPNVEYEINDLVDEEPKAFIDSDLDGVHNGIDDFKFNPEETTDTDGDGVGNNTDPDDDGDGVSDDDDAFPLDSGEVSDADGDGVGDNSDEFANDSSEWRDSDEDGVGDNADADDDNDGFEDVIDAFPFNPSEFMDSDGDGFGDESDAFPSDPTEHLDSDSDGVGDNADAFPQDSSETLDSDSDGVGDNADDYPTNSDASRGIYLNIMGVAGPMAGADITVFDLQDYLDNSDAAKSLLESPATSDPVTALADGLLLAPDSGTGPYLVVVTANQTTLDLSTGKSPVITEVKTITNPTYFLSDENEDGILSECRGKLLGSLELLNIEGNLGPALAERVGTEGFQFAATERTIFDPDTNADGNISDDELIAFYNDGIKTFGVNDTIDDTLANGSLGANAALLPDCPEINSADDIYTSANGACPVYMITNDELLSDCPSNMTPFIILPPYRIYATPLTTVAVAIAMEGEVDADDVVANLYEAQLSAKAFFGFGMLADINIFNQAPILDEYNMQITPDYPGVRNALEVPEHHSQVAQYRAAIEALVSVVESTDLNFSAFIDDSRDGIFENIEIISAIQSVSLVDVIRRFHDSTIHTIAQLLSMDAHALAKGFVIHGDLDESFKSVIDSDVDGANNVDDDFDFDPAEVMDTDSDGVGDNADAFPHDPEESIDSDSDGTGDNSDVLPNEPNGVFDRSIFDEDAALFLPEASSGTYGETTWK